MFIVVSRSDSDGWLETESGLPPIAMRNSAASSYIDGNLDKIHEAPELSIAKGTANFSATSSAPYLAYTL